MRQAGFFDTRHLAADDLNHCPGFIFRRTRRQMHARNAGDTRQRLAAKAEGGDGE